MPAAANLMKTLTPSDAAPAASATPGGEAFAAMLSGTEAAADAATTEEAVVATEATVEVQPNLDILAPLLAQQQVVPTVTVPKPGAEGAVVEGAANPDVGSMLEATPASPLVPSEVDARPVGASGPHDAETAPVTTNGLDQALAGAPRLRSGRAGGEGPSQAIGTSVDLKAVEPGQANAADSVKAVDKTGSQPTIAPTISAVQTAAGDQQPSGGGRQSEAPAPTVEVPAQQQTSSVTDVRSLIASLTSATGLAGVGGPAQAGAAQQLGQALAAQVLDLAGGSAWLEQLSEEIGRAADGSGPLRFRLTPESLGELKVEISQGDRGAIVRMTVATEAAQAALADAQPRLAAEARAQGLRIAETQVDLAGNQTQQHQQGRESARQQAAAGDQPLRAFRTAASSGTATQTATASSRSAERYA